MLLKCTCNACSGHLEFDATHAGETICCPHCGKDTTLFLPGVRPGTFSKKHVAMLVVCAGAVLFGLWQWAGLRRGNADAKWDEPKNVSRSERPHDLREMAQQAMLSECSNLVGFHRIVGNPYVYGQSGDPTNWDGWAEAEFVNKVGGIERTNLRFRFRAYSDMADMVFARPEAQYERLERWRKEAPEDVRKLSTNYVVGFSAITRVDVSGDYSSYDPNNWRATAKVEFVNASGGMQFTNLPFKFSTHSDHIFAETGLGDEELAKIRSEAKERMDVLDRAHEEALRRVAAGTLAGPRTWTFRKGATLAGSLVRFQGTNAVVISRT